MKNWGKCECVVRMNQVCKSNKMKVKGTKKDQSSP